MQAISAEAVSEATVDTGVSGDSFTVNEHMGGTSGLRRHRSLAGWLPTKDSETKLCVGWIADVMSK